MNKTYMTAFPTVGLLLAVLLAGLIAPARATNTVSQPAGFVRVDLVGTGAVLVSTPFDLFDPDINWVFPGQLTGATNITAADSIRKWDPALQAYTNAYKADNTGDSSKDGFWFTDFTSWSTSTLSFFPGEGFWIESRHSSTQTVFLSGWIVLDSVMTNSLPAQYSLFSYPFSTALGLNGSDLKNDGATAGTTPEDSDTIDAWAAGGYDNYFLHNNSGDASLHWKWCFLSNASPVVASSGFRLGSGYWYRNLYTNGVAWTESRPYANPFPANSEPPRIVEMTPNAAGDEVTLTITATGVAGELLDIYYKNMTSTGTFTSTGWSIADLNLATLGATNVVWIDAGSANRGKINTVYARCYLAGRADLDADSDGLPNAREQFVYGTLTNDSDTDNDGLSDGLEVNTYGTDPLNPDTDNDGMSDGMEVARGFDPTLNNNYATLPFMETFESLTTGAIDGQNGWTSDPATAGLVSTNSPYQGTKALQIQASAPVSTVEHLFGAVGVTNVWSGFRSKLSRRESSNLPSVGSDAAAAFFVNANGQLVVYNGSITNWTTLTNHAAISTSAWTRIVINQNFINHTWSLWLDGTSVAQNLGFANNVSEFSVARFLGAKYGITCVDDVAIAAQGDADSDGMSDDWEVFYGLNPTVNDAAADADNDGLSNLDEYLNGTDPWNDDTDNDGVLDGEEVAQGRDPLASGTVADTTGTLVGLKVFTVLE